MRSEKGRGAWAEAAVAAAGMCVFALFIHSRAPWRMAAILGLATTTVALCRCMVAEPCPSELLGLRRSPRAGAVSAILGLSAGLALGIACRLGYGRPLLPGGLTRFVLPAMLIGAVEEIVYRGYLQGRVRPWGWVRAAAFAAACHTAYKACLFAWPSGPLGVGRLSLLLCTFLVGMGLGALREKAGSVWPPVLAHAAFDLILYGERAQAPWWVWS